MNIALYVRQDCDKKRRRPVTTTFSRCTCWQNATLSIGELRGCSLLRFLQTYFPRKRSHRHPALIVRKKWICARRKEKVSNQGSLCNVYLTVRSSKARSSRTRKSIFTLRKISQLEMALLRSRVAREILTLIFINRF